MKLNPKFVKDIELCENKEQVLKGLEYFISTEFYKDCVKRLFCEDETFYVFEVKEDAPTDKYSLNDIKKIRHTILDKFDIAMSFDDTLSYLLNFDLDGDTETANELLKHLQLVC